MKISSDKNWFLTKDYKGKSLNSVEKNIIEKLRNKKAFLVRDIKINDIQELEKFSQKFGKILDYGQKNYIEFREVSVENELHYDGLSQKSKKRMPKYIFFWVKKTHRNSKKKINKGRFQLLNSFLAAQDLPPDLRKKLRKKTLKFYGAKTYFKPRIKSDEFSFEQPFFGKINNKLNIRSHLMSKHNKQLSKDGKFIISSEGFKMSFSDCTGLETLNLFREINNNILNKKNYKKITFKKNDLLIVDNRYVFHGREKVFPPQKRLIIRVQVI